MRKGLKIDNIHFAEAMKLLDHSRIDRAPVDIEAYTVDGHYDRLESWMVTNDSGKNQTHTFWNPKTLQTRKYKDILIMKINTLKVRL